MTDLLVNIIFTCLILAILSFIMLFAGYACPEKSKFAVIVKCASFATLFASICSLCVFVILFIWEVV